MYSYYVGLDLGQARDYSALAILEEPLWMPGAPARNGIPARVTGWASPAGMDADTVSYVSILNRRHGRPYDVPLSLRHLERFALGTSYPMVVERVRSLLDSDLLRDKGTVLLVDKTGVGASVVDSFEWAGCRPVPITIHGGSSVGRDTGGGYRVPKRDLVSAVQILLQNRRLRIADALPEAETLKNELLNFRVKLDPRTAHDSYEHWREGDHDDLVLATAMACWFRQWWNANLILDDATRAV